MDTFNLPKETYKSLFEMMLRIRMVDEKIAGKIFNVGYENYRVSEIAEMVRNVVGRENTKITTRPTNDNRSYHVSSEKIKHELGFQPKHTIEDAIRDLCDAFNAGKIPNPMDDIRYYNIRTMLARQLK